MALSYSEANVSNSGNTTNTGGYTLAHTPVANTKCVVAITTQYDSSATDINWSAGSPTYGGVAMSTAVVYKSASGYGQVSIHYLKNPAIAAANFVSSFAGSNTDAQTTIIDLVDATADTVTLDTTNTGTTDTDNSHACNV